ncbi:hypothetical protein M088_5029 [Bacteroides ovatus str. 3725 D1 iv]|uniref:Uncharacterized protein n=1 Tax=Bacteroides ovatus (strain ATCC 8483 / DSM 1896 / JCM 5824 / BCRC 10623 / CCUG 4943 / NCTC 11153) TaxID=411476 RepID=A0AAN3A4V5_BACO1|nr:hypothetical protein BACOVA_04137 [Bacteroides ovatus ATCC 8483]KDS24297.1 hypothetical protein M088_5029 [Bacteroides ovatus str. 3725 D1 iv]
MGRSFVISIINDVPLFKSDNYDLDPCCYSSVTVDYTDGIF